MFTKGVHNKCWVNEYIESLHQSLHSVLLQLTPLSLKRDTEHPRMEKQNVTATSILLLLSGPASVSPSMKRG